MYFSEWNIFLEANLLLIILLVFIYLVGYSFNFICHRLFNIKSEYSVFKTLFYGILLIIYFFVLFKSRSIVNSVFLSGIPICLFIYEYFLHKNFNDVKKNEAFNSKTIVISLITIAIILIAKFKYVDKLSNINKTDVGIAKMISEITSNKGLLELKNKIILVE